MGVPAEHARRHKHQPKRDNEPFQRALPFAFPARVSHPKRRGDCEPCPVCQEAREHGVHPLSCGHRGEEVLWHSRPCVFAGCRYSLELDVVGCSIVLNAPGKPRCDSCALDVADRRLGLGVGSDVVADLLGITRERAEAIEACALRKSRAHVAKGWIR